MVRVNLITPLVIGISRGVSCLLLQSFLYFFLISGNYLFNFSSMNMFNFSCINIRHLKEWGSIWISRTSNKWENFAYFILSNKNSISRSNFQKKRLFTNPSSPEPNSDKKWVVSVSSINACFKYASSLCTTLVKLNKG